MEMKSRSLGHSSPPEHVAIESNEDAKPDDVEQLKRWLEHFARQYKVAAADKERCEDMMRRPGAKKWSSEKTQKMVRRLMLANKTVEQAEETLDQITQRLSQLGVEVSIESRSVKNVA